MNVFKWGEIIQKRQCSKTKNGSYRNSKQINIGFNGQCNVTNNMLMIEN